MKRHAPEEPEEPEPPLFDRDMEAVKRAMDNIWSRIVFDPVTPDTPTKLLSDPDVDVRDVANLYPETEEKP